MTDALKEKISKSNQGIMSFWFVRHGQSEGNVMGSECLVMNDAPLTQRGTEEAKAIAKYLKEQDIQIDAIYTSPLGRSHQTSEVIGKDLSIPIKIKDGFKERNWGDWGNLPWDEVSERLSKHDINKRYTFTPPNGESWQDMEQRLLGSLEEIAEESSVHGNILIVTHRGCLRAILPVLAKAGKDKHEDFSVETGSLTKFAFHKDEFEFIGLNPINRSTIRNSKH